MHFSSLFKFCPRCGSGSFIQNTEKSKLCDDCGFEMFVNASAAVALFILNNQNQLLICKRAKDPAKGAFDLPGGFVDENETVEQAIAREAKEELNVKVTKTSYLFSIPNQYEYCGWTIPTIDLFFLCETESFTDLKAGDDVAEVEFIAAELLHPDDFGFSSIRKGIMLFKQKNHII